MSRLFLLLRTLTEPKSKDKDSRRREFVLNVVVLASFFLMGMVILERLMREDVDPTTIIALLVLGILGLFSLFQAWKTKIDLKIERDFLEEKIEERTKELKQAQTEQMVRVRHFAEFGRMTAGLLHDIANPLTSLALHLENLKRKSKDPMVAASMPLVLRNIKFIEEILTIGKNQVQKQNVNVLFSPIEQTVLAIQMITYRAEKEDIVLEFPMPSSRIITFGNPIEFFRIISCLILNAVDSYSLTDSKGRTIKREKDLEHKENKSIYIKLEEEDGVITLSVTDFGCGISAKNLPKIFTPLFTTKDIEDGIGLGLTICKEVIEDDFGGTIDVQSEETMGSVFTLKFPVKESDTNGRMIR